MEQCIGMILQAAEIESRTTVWKDLHAKMQDALKTYQQFLKNCRGRREFQECQECLDRLTKILKNARQSEEDSRLTCCICLDAEVNCSANCGHLFCATCAQSIEQCPICRKPILPEHIRPVFIP